MFFIHTFEDAHHSCDTESVSTFERAVSLGLACYAQASLNGPATVSICDEGGKCLRFYSNKRIKGTFSKQVWGGRKGDVAMEFGKEEFDPTDEVLLMNLEQLHRLEDYDDTSDDLGLKFIEWDGPFGVSVVHSICDFFGVEALNQITQEAIDFAREQIKPRKPQAESVVLKIKLDTLTRFPANFREFLFDMEVSVKSNTAGVLVTNVEILDQE